MGANLLPEGTAALRRFLEEIFEKVWREVNSRCPPYGEMKNSCYATISTTLELQDHCSRQTERVLRNISHVPHETKLLFVLINCQTGLMHLTWNKKNLASLSAGPAPVGCVPTQRAVAPEAKTQKNIAYLYSNIKCFFRNTLEKVNTLLARRSSCIFFMLDSSSERAF